MSVRVMTAVWAMDLPDSEKIVLLALADCANDEGHCWPSMATLARKCSKSERTVQGCIQSLKDKGHLSRDEVLGKGCSYIVHPRKDCAPAETAPHPRKRCATPPQPLRTNRKEPSGTVIPLKRAIPDDWQPAEFGVGTQSRKVVDNWPPGEHKAQLEHFKAHHRGKGNKFIDPQDAWSTWVLNTRKFGIGRNDNRIGKSQAAYQLATAGLDPNAPF